MIGMKKELIVRKIVGLSLSFIIVFGLFGPSILGAIAIFLIDGGIDIFNRLYTRSLNKKKRKRGFFEKYMGVTSANYGRCLDITLNYIRILYDEIDKNNKREEKGLKTI